MGDLFFPEAFGWEFSIFKLAEVFFGGTAGPQAATDFVGVAAVFRPG